MEDYTDTGKLLIGAHVSAAGGAYKALLEAQQIGATTLQLFTANQKRWQAKALSLEDIRLWEGTLERAPMQKIMSHDSYLINLGSPNDEILDKSRIAFEEEIGRCHALKIDYLNFHPGAALQADPQQCLDRIVQSLLQYEKLLATGPTRLLLETTAGQGSAQGSRFEQLAYIITNVEKHLPIGVCIDTCHVFVAGYDIRTPEAWDATLDEFDRVVGLDHLYAFHVNDSRKGLASRVDRHAPLGEGLIGLESFKTLMQNPRTRDIPKYLETPGGLELWEKEINMLRTFASPMTVGETLNAH
jgi:deoxyribonuclease-4